MQDEGSHRVVSTFTFYITQQTTGYLLCATETHAGLDDPSGFAASHAEKQGNIHSYCPIKYMSIYYICICETKYKRIVNCIV